MVLVVGLHPLLHVGETGFRERETDESRAVGRETDKGKAKRKN